MRHGRDGRGRPAHAAAPRPRPSALARATRAPRASRCSTCRTTPTGCIHPLKRAGGRASSSASPGRRRSTTSPRACARSSAPRPAVGRLVHGQPGRVQLLPHAVGQGLPRRARHAALLLRRRRRTSTTASPPPRCSTARRWWCRSPTSTARDFLFMVGANPLVSHGSVLSAPRMREQLNAIVDRGGRVVVVDPRRSETARQYEHVAIRPDTDAWLLLSMLHVIFAEGLADDAALAAQRARRRARWPRGRAVSARAHRGAHRRARRDGARSSRATSPTRRQRRRLRAHRFLPRPLRHAGRVPARRAQRRHRQPRPARRRGVRPPADRARRGRRESRPRHIRQGALAHRRVPRRDRQPARRR